MSTLRSQPFWQPELGSSEREYLRQALDENYLNDGRLTTEFENQLAKLLEVPHAVAVTSCTAAIYLALYGLGIGPGDEVLVPDVTFVATANAVTMTGAKPILVDVEESSLMLDPERARQAITARTRAIVPVHVSGRPAPMEAIARLAQEHSLFVVEDAAEALLSRYKGQCLGTLGDAGCFSFSPNKTITTGQGGVIVTRNRQLAGRLRELKDQGRPSQGTGGADMHDSIGFNFKLTNLQSAVGLGQLELLRRRADRLRAIGEQYRASLGSLSALRFLPEDLEGGTVPQWIDVCVEERRDELIAYLKGHGMSCREFWHPVHTHKPYRLPDADFPVSSKLVPMSCWLPSAFQLTSSDVDEVCKRIRDFFTHT